MLSCFRHAAAIAGRLTSSNSTSSKLFKVLDFHDLSDSKTPFGDSSTPEKGSSEKDTIACRVKVAARKERLLSSSGLLRKGSRSRNRPQNQRANAF
ncbi:hypothetical protein ACP70R_002733 [Stipagrostis hirtigluma subsp. patula]